jgi:hypothetical protein
LDRLDKPPQSPIALLQVQEAQRGFVINGEVAGDYSGHSVSNAGDVNGDGLDDLIVGAYPRLSSHSNHPLIHH